MKKNEEIVASVILIVLIIVTLFLVGYLEGKSGYRRGQTDALHGVWKYQLVTNSTENVVEIK